MNNSLDFVRLSLRNIILQRKDVTLLACKQRAKFEGWMKFELAAVLASDNQYSQVTLEDNYQTRGRADISFMHQSTKWYVEMKTANTNWRADGLENITRPIAGNIDGIIDDIQVLKVKCPPDKGMAVFVIFPVPVRIWDDEPEKLTYHLHRIEEETGISTGTLLSNADFMDITENFGMCSFVVEVV
jgi:hypothetical protein